QDLTDRLSHTVQVGYTTKRYEQYDADDGLLGYHAAPFDAFNYNGIIYNQGDPVAVYDDVGGVAAFYDDKNTQIGYDLLFEAERFSFLAGAEYLDQSADQ